VNLIKKERGKFSFQLTKEEKQLLLALLGHYPLVPARHQSLSKSAPPSENETNQRLLDEALAEQRRENQQRIKTLLNDKRHFHRADPGWRLALSASGIEWLLQVLNDIRVGSWINLGSPKDHLWEFDLNEASAPHAWAMETAGWFQSALLEALQGDDPAPRPE